MIQKSLKRIICACIFSFLFTCAIEKRNPEKIDSIIDEAPMSEQGQGGDTGCEEGSSRSCHITLGNHEGILSCYVGIQKCIDGEWSQCSE